MRDGAVIFPSIRFLRSSARRVAAAVSAAACVAVVGGCAGGAPRGDGAEARSVGASDFGTMVESPSRARTLGRNGHPAHQLSGLAWWHDDRYLAIGDDGAAFLWELRIAIDPATGALTEAEVVGGIPLEVAPRDGEALAWIAAPTAAPTDAPTEGPTEGLARLLVADEEDSTMLEYAVAREREGAPATASFVGRRAASPLFAPAALRPNLGLESLGAIDGWTWSASEDARRDDGACATVDAGSFVRIERRDPSGAPAGQWAYRTDPVPARALSAELERSGVVDIVPIARDAALVLERAVGGVPFPVVRSRVYAIDTRGATDVSAIASLVDGGSLPLGKRLLWEDAAAGANFEGLAIGPRLEDGRVALVLVADDGGGAMGQRALVRVLLWDDAGACDQRAASPARPTKEK